MKLYRKGFWISCLSVLLIMLIKRMCFVFIQIITNNCRRIIFSKFYCFKKKLFVFSYFINVSRAYGTMIIKKRFFHIFRSKSCMCARVKFSQDKFLIKATGVFKLNNIFPSFAQNAPVFKSYLR